MPPATERPTTSAAVAPQSARPPRRVPAGPVVLRCLQPDDAGDLAAAVGESLDHLRPWMPWATREAADHRTQLARIAESADLWESGTDYMYGIFAADGPGHADGMTGGPAGAAGGPGSGTHEDGPAEEDTGEEDTGEENGPLVGTIGLHRRAGEDIAEIGYWIAVGHTRRGYGTAAAGAVTALALALPGVRQVQIHCDEANVASAAIPRKLGYRLDRTEAHKPEAPGEQGRRMIWVWDRPGRDARDGAR